MLTKKSVLMESQIYVGNSMRTYSWFVNIFLTYVYGTSYVYDTRQHVDEPRNILCEHILGSSTYTCQHIYVNIYMARDKIYMRYPMYILTNQEHVRIEFPIDEILEILY